MIRTTVSVINLLSVAPQWAENTNIRLIVNTRQLFPEALRQEHRHLEGMLMRRFRWSQATVSRNNLILSVISLHSILSCLYWNCCSNDFVGKMRLSRCEFASFYISGCNQTLLNPSRKLYPMLRMRYKRGTHYCKSPNDPPQAWLITQGLKGN